MLPPDLRYERYAPGALLADYVEHFWLVANDVGPTPRSEILIPNGRPMILVCLGERGSRVEIDTGERITNGNLVGGIKTAPVIIEQAGVSIYVAAQLTPFGLAGFFERERLIDGIRYFEDWLGDNASASLVADVKEAELGEPAVRVFERFLETRLLTLPKKTIERLRAAVAVIEASEALVEVGQLAQDIGISYTALYRLFSRYFGISPKQFIAIARYYRLVGGLLFGNMQGGLAQLAVLRGYYDQAHATKDFRRFTGVSQTTFKSTLNGIARLMHRG